MRININNKYLFDGYYKVKCAVGKRGISSKKKEGDLKTPKGKFKILYVLYRKDRVPKINVKIKKIQIKKNMGWCDDPKNKFYNKLVKISNKVKCEKLFRRDRKYDYLIQIDHNTKRIIPYNGSAIFLHLTSNYKPTAGCIAINRNDMKILLKIIKRKSFIKIF